MRTWALVALAAAAEAAVLPRRVHAPRGAPPPVYLYLAPRGAPGGGAVPGTNSTIVPTAAPLSKVPPLWRSMPTQRAPEVPKYLLAVPGSQPALREILRRIGSLSPVAEGFELFETTEPHEVWQPAVLEFELARRDALFASGNATVQPHARCAHAALIPAPPMSDTLRRRLAAAGPLPSAAPAASKGLIVGGIGAGEAEDTLRVLSGADAASIPGRGEVSFTTRMSTTEMNLLAAEWIGAQLLEAGACDDLEYQEFLVSRKTTRNVICVRYGTTKPDEIVVVGAHFDSIPSSGNAPGAVDNGSGSSSVMMIAKAFAQHKFERTLHLICFSGEEQGLHGSRHYVNGAVAEERPIIAAITMDMTAYSSRYFGVSFEGDRRSDIAAVMANAADNLEWLKGAEGLGSKLTSQSNWNSFGSDHVPFQQAGYPAILLIERDDTAYPAYHRINDQVDFANWDQMRDIARIAAAQAIDYAGLVA
eukprot:TRINITY_DN51375_c0_g1_i1.p1 TRINITY_DN51375_c0_g1~~TRINITY_DN51375_c0_g1_i1.p1  ORF type:complete len:501 (+),score=190.04 TRINITY_DN51375_c0_g1_i1:76-1503(+)